MRHVAAALVAAILIAGAGCSSDGVRAGEAVVDVAPGSRVLIGERGQGLHEAEGRRTVGAGTEVKVLAGTASIALDDGARLDVRKGSELTLSAPLSLVADDLLVTSGRRPVTVAVGGSEVSVDGVARVRRDLAVSAATYRGSVTIRSAARSLVVPALRQAEVPSLGVLPARAEPLDHRRADAWDRRFLGVAIELGEQLQSRSRGFTSQLPPGAGFTPGFYRILLPALESEAGFGEDLLPTTRDPGDTLVGAAIAVSGRLGTFAERWGGVFGFRAEGASWGLVALDQRVNDADGLVSVVDLAIGNQSFAFAPSVVSVAAVDVPADPIPAAAAPEPVVPPETPVVPPAVVAPPATPAAGTPPLITLPALPELIPPPDPSNPGILAPLLDVVTDTLSGLLSGG